MVDAVVSNIAVDEPAPITPLVIDDGQPQAVPLPPEVAAARANKAAFGLSKVTGKSKDDYVNAISSGAEGVARQDDAAKVDGLRVQMAKDMLAQGQFSSVQDVANLTKATDPNAVFEEHYAKEYIDKLNWSGSDRDKDSWLYDAMVGVPEEFDAAKKQGQGLVFKRQMLLTRVQNAEADVKQQSWVPYLVDTAMDMVGYGEVKQRGQVPDVGMITGGLGLGTNLEQQSFKLFQMSDEDFTKQLEKIDASFGDNPSLKASFYKSMLGMSSSDVILNNIFTGANVAGLADIGKAIATPIARKLAFTNQVYRAVRDMAKSVPDNIPPEVAAPAVAGKALESAVQKVKIDTIDEIKGTADPVKQMQDRLGDIYQTDAGQVKANPGRFGLEAANRLSDAMLSVRDKLFNAISAAMKVDRTPSVEIEANARKIQQEIANRHRGVDNTVLNVGKGIYLPELNVRAYNVAIGTQEGDLFSTRGEALVNAKLNGHVIINNLVDDPAVQAKYREISNFIHLSREQGLKDQEESFLEQLAALPRHKEGSTIEEQGGKFYINKVVYLPEKEDFVKNVYLTHKMGGMTHQEFQEALSKGISTGIPPSWGSGMVNAILGRLRNPGERMSISEMINRDIATTGPNVLLAPIREGAKIIKRIPKAYWEDFNRMIKYTQKRLNEETGLPGKGFDNPAEIENFYTQYIKDRDGNPRLPSPQEIEAYFNYKELILNDLSVRSIEVHKNKLILGTEEHAFNYKDGSGNKLSTPFIEGVRKFTPPNDFFNVLYMGATKKDHKVYHGWDSMPKALREELEANLSSGGNKTRVVHLLDPKTKPLSDLTSERVDYVVSHDMDTKPLGFKPINRVGDGHLIPEWDYYFKQANMDVDKRLAIYNGDKTFMSFQRLDQAKEILPKLEKVRLLLEKHIKLSPEDEESVARFEGEGGATGKDWLEQAAEANRETGIPWHTVYDAFIGKKWMSVHEPIHIVPKNTLIGQMGEEGVALRNRYSHLKFVDSTQGEGSLLAKAMVEFTGERDAQELYTVVNKGSKQDPIYSYEPAAYLDPITTMERAYSRIIKSAYIDDMKQFSVEHWAQQAKDYINVRDPEEVTRNPMHYFFSKPDYKKGVPFEVWSQLESNRLQAKEFLGVMSDTDKAIYRLSQKAVDTVYGTKLGKSKYVMMTLDKMAATRDPVGLVRSWAFHATEGFFNPKAFFTQAATYFNILSISPKHAPSAAMASLLYGITRINNKPETIAYLDKLASELTLTGRLGITSRFKPGQFAEAMQLLDGSGFAHVGNTHSFQGRIPTNRVIRNGAQTFLDWGTTPFNIGASSTRVAGFFTAYLEHMAEHPGAAISRTDAGKILHRANLLDHNMSSAYASKAHTGLMSLPMQFGAYSLRVMEMLTGKQLSREEKARLLVGSSLMWGVRGGALGLAGLPLANWVIKETEAYYGYVTGQNTLIDFVVNGLPALIANVITGTWYDLSRWGNQGAEQLAEIFSHEKSIAEAATGVVGSLLENTIKGASNFYRALTAPSLFPPTGREMLDLFKSLSTVRDIDKLQLALRTGRWFTQNETYVGDISQFNAWVAALTGAIPTRLTDVYNKQSAVKDIEEDLKHYTKQYEINIERALRAGVDQDDSNLKHYFAQANSILQLIPFDKRASVVRQAFEAHNKDLASRVDWKLFMEVQHDPETFQKIQQILMQGK